MTKYAKKILEIVERSSEHLTTEQIYSALKQDCPRVVLATVYNNLNRLWEAGLVRRISQEGMPDRYDRVERHDHLVCRRCGKLLDIDLGDLTGQLQERAGVSFLTYDLKLIYICEDCRERERHRARTR